MPKINLIILAAGKSSRFYPLSNKNLLPILGKSLVQKQIEKFNQYPFKQKIVVIPKFKSNQFIKIVQPFSKDNWNIVQQEQDGMGGAVLSALRLININDPALIVNMDDWVEDSLLDLVFKKIYSKTYSQKGLLVGHYQLGYFPGGYLAFDKNQQVTQIVEKPVPGTEPSKYVKLVFDYLPSLVEFKKILENTKTNKDDLYEEGLSLLIKKGIVFEICEYKDNWQTLKYPFDTLKLMYYFLQGIKKTVISKEALVSKRAIINGQVIIEKGAKIMDGAIIQGPVFIGNNSIIGNHTLVRESNIGNNSVVGFGSEVARSYLNNNVWLHMNYVGDSIIDSNVSFGSTAVTANLRLDEKTISVQIKGNKINSNTNKLGAIIGENVRIGVGAKIMPGIKIGKNTVIGPNTVIKKDINDNEVVYSKSVLTIKKNKTQINNRSQLIIEK